MCAVLQSEREIAQGVDLQSPALLFGAASFASEPTLGRLRPNFGAAIKTLTMEMDSIARRLIHCRSKQEFLEARAEVFPSYQKLSFAIGNIIGAVLKGVDHARLIEESLEFITKKFCAEENGYLGADEKQEIAFSISTLKAAYALLPTLFSRPIPAQNVQEDRSLAEYFAIHVLIFQLSLICLKEATSRAETINPDVLQEIIEGFRGSVMAYSYVRQALDLRGFSDAKYSENIGPVPWDDEDKTFVQF